MPAPLPLLASSRSSAHYTISAESLSSGGGSAASANFSNTSSLGATAAVSTRGVYQNRGGFVGQLAVPAQLSVLGVPVSIAEHTQVAPTFQIALDDGTISIPDPTNAAWSEASDYLSIIVDSQVTVSASAVYEDSSASFTCSYAGIDAQIDLTITNVNPDDFGSYAGDGLPDDWQVKHFGEDNPNAAPGSDPNGDGLDNLKSFVLVIDPTSPQGTYPGPTSHFGTDGGDTYLTITFRRPVQLLGLIDLVVESAPSFAGPWTPTSYTLDPAQEDAEGNVTVTARDTVPISASDLRFLRLVIRPLSTQP